jgi:Cu+-exporting ATPase
MKYVNICPSKQSMNPATLKDTLCYHCGDKASKSYALGEKLFCCQGCKTVHQILAGNGLDGYYKLQDRPGVKISFAPDTEEFAYLDNPEIAVLLLDYDDGEMVKLSLQIPSIHCSSCIWLLEHLQKLHPGIHWGRVDFLKKEFTASIDSKKLSVRQLAELLNSIGYKPLITLENQQQKKTQHSNKELILKLGVAGFCFGNIMLFSFSEYFGLSSLQYPQFERFFSYLNFILAIPVLFYSGQHYLTSAWKSITRGILHINVPLALGMVAFFGRSAYEILSKTGPGYMDSLSGLIFFLLIGKWFQDYTYEHLSFERDYKSYFPLAVTVKDNGQWVSRLLSKITKGNRLRIKNGELLAADGILLSGDGQIDYSFVTGESVPVHRIVGEMVYGGGRQVGGTIEVEITKDVSQSQLSKIWNANYSDKDAPSRLVSFSSKVSHYFTIVLLLVAFASLIYWSFTDVSKGFFAFTSVLIIACPCALALSSPLALGNTLRILGRKGLYLKNVNVVEELAHTDHIVFDKTGTLTKTNDFSIKFEGEDLSNAQLAAVKGLASHSNHPFSRAIYQSLTNVDVAGLSKVHEIPGNGLLGFHESFGEIRMGSAEFTESNSIAIGSGVYLKIGSFRPGYFSINAEYRPFVKKLLNRLSKKFKLSVLSGDSYRESSKLKNLFGRFENAFFEQSPEDKLSKIEAMRKDQMVMMVGDGLNDAGALLSSDVGLVVVEDTAQFTPAAKGIITAKDLTHLPDLLLLTRKTVNIIKGSFCISTIYNIVGLWFAVQGLLSPLFAAILMPLSSITIILFNTVATNVAAKIIERKWA